MPCILVVCCTLTDPLTHEYLLHLCHLWRSVQPVWEPATVPGQAPMAATVAGFWKRTQK